MYVRWQKRSSIAQAPQLRQLRLRQGRFNAILVESVRIDGWPRQRHIAFLGSINEDHSDRIKFWRDVRQALDGLGKRVPPEDRRKIEAAIAERVPKATARQADR